MSLSVCLIVISLLLAPGAQASRRQVVRNTRGQFRVVRFPQRWLESGKQKESGQWITTAEYEIRRDPKSAKNELLFGALSLESHNYSMNLYGVRLNNSSPRRVTGPRWERSRTVESKTEHVFPVSGDDEPAATYEYAGRKYVVLGKSGGEAILSPARKHLALMSYTDATRPSPMFPALGGGEAMKGTAFWVVYDTRSGTQVLSGQMSYSRQSAGVMFSHARWVDEEYFVLPLDNQYQTFFIGLLPH